MAAETRREVAAFFASCALCAFAAPAGAQNNIPVRRVTPAVSTDSGVFGLLMGVRALPDGRVLVNDFRRKRLIALDSTLKRITVIADTAAGAPHPYWLSGTILPYVGDSTVFVDQQAEVLIVIDPSAGIGRTMALPKSGDISNLMAGAAVGPSQGFDPMGRLVYRVVRRPPMSQLPPQLPAADSGKVTVTVRHDSAAVVRADPETRRVDTVAFLTLPVTKTVVTSLGRGRSMPAGAMSPLQSADDWALLSDGTIAVVRVADYHIDWYRPNGTSASTPKMAFDWRRVTDEDKQRMLDSARKDFETRKAAAPPAPPPPRPGLDGGGVFFSGPGSMPMGDFVGVDPADMPDYYPPIRAGSVKADRDGNVWILPTTSLLAGNGLVFDVINQKGEVFERVQIPVGRTIVAFGPGGVLYLASQWGGRVPRLERVKVIRREVSMSLHVGHGVRRSDRRAGITMPTRLVHAVPLRPRPCRAIDS